MPAFARLSCATLTAFFIATQAQPSDLHAQVSALLTRVEDLEGQLMAQRRETQTAIQQSQDALTRAAILENRVAQLERWNLSQSTHLRQTQSDDDTLVHIHRVALRDTICPAQCVPVVEINTHIAPIRCLLGILFVPISLE